jgi:hypothetical protein
MPSPAQQDDAPPDLDMAARCQRSAGEIEAVAAAIAEVCRRSWAEIEATNAGATARARPGQG